MFMKSKTRKRERELDQIRIKLKKILINLLLLLLHFNHIPNVVNTFKHFKSSHKIFIKQYLVLNRSSYLDERVYFIRLNQFIVKNPKKRTELLGLKKRLLNSIIPKSKLSTHLYTPPVTQKTTRRTTQEKRNIIIMIIKSL